MASTPAKTDLPTTTPEAVRAAEPLGAGIHWNDPGPVALVQCLLLRGSESQQRYVRQSEFGLWRHLMENRHGQIVVTQRTSHWLSEELAVFEVDFRTGAYEPLVRLCCVIWGPGGLPMPLERYIPTDELEPAQSALLGHYAGRLEHHSITLIPGYFMPTGEDESDPPPDA